MQTIRNEGKKQIFWKESFPEATVRSQLPDRVLILLIRGDSGGAALCLWAARPFELVRTGYQGTFTS